MDILDVVLIVAITTVVVGGIFLALYEVEFKYLERENRMLWRLLSDQAKLHKMSLDAYNAMLQASSPHTGR